MLTQLELFGFKSFADRTVFGFAPGITCVVGPNGSGKSNVVDAIKWILGDQSPKSLRGKDMADVIFNGSAGRKPSGLAEATLTFNNESRVLRVDAPVVQVGRRLYRSGESEYLLNGAVVRLKDVRDALMGTGAGTSAYSIIEQGRVDQILQANPTTRRVVFEEAAGISRYQHRRVDAERKLERVAQNLARLTDIVREVESQLIATRNQASRAARYREVSLELRTLWTGLAADDCRHLSGELAAAETLADRNRGEVERLGQELAECDAARLEIEQALAGLDEELQSQHRQLSANREAIASRESTIRHQSARQRELDADVAELRRERLRLNTRVRAMAGELRETAARLERFEHSLREQQSALAGRDALVAELQQQAAGARERLAGQRRRQQELAERRTAHAGRAAILISQSTSTHEALLDAVRRQQAGEAAVERARGEHAQSRAALDQAGQALGQATADVERLQGERLRLLDEQGHSEQSLGAMRDQRVAWEARIHVLEDLERRQEGLGLGVREILRRAEQVDLPPWNSLLGCVGDLLDVPLEHAALLELALGHRAQLIVTRDLDAVADYLNRGDAPISGRVGFLGLDSGAHRPESGDAAADELDFGGQPGVVARADRLAQAAPAVAGLAARLLAGTWVVETLSVARRLAAAHPGRCRFVTLQGELIDADGTLHAGTVPHETSLVSRKSELRRLRFDLQQLDDDIAEQFRELTELGLNLTSVDGALAEAEEHKQHRSEHLSQARMELAAQERELQRQSGELERQAARTAELATLEQQQEQDLAAAREGVAECETELADIEDAARRAECDLAEIERTLAEVAEESQRQQLELAKHEERVHGLREAQSRLEREQEQRREQLRHATERMQAADQARQAARLHVLNTQSAIAELTLDTERLGDQAARAESRRAEFRLRRGALHRREDELHRRRRELTDAQHDCELRIRETRQQLAALEQRIEEEYQVRLPDLVADGASACARWRSGGEGTHVAETDESPAGLHSTGGDAQNSAEGTAATLPSDQGGVSFLEVRPQIEEEVQRLRRKLKSMGHVNTEALESLDELENRFARLSGQLQDLTEARSALEDIIRRINGESRRMFVETFESIRKHFRELFRKLFGGGEADIVLEDPGDVLECGIDIVARPPGKELRSITLLSGGEKTLTAIALLFAMFRSKPSPYCILDEVDAALDEANVERYASILHDFVQMTQFVVITHRKRTMTAADVIYGVTMEQAGVSKRMSVRFEEVGENGEIRSRSGRAA